MYNVSRCFIFEKWPYQVVEPGCELFREQLGFQVCATTPVLSCCLYTNSVYRFVSRQQDVSACQLLYFSTCSPQRLQLQQLGSHSAQGFTFSMCSPALTACFLLTVAVLTILNRVDILHESFDLDSLMICSFECCMCLWVLGILGIFPLRVYACTVFACVWVCGGPRLMWKVLLCYFPPD